jgi:hypothetical protein
MLMFVVVPAMKSSPFYWHYHYTLSAREIQYSARKRYNLFSNPEME